MEERIDREKAEAKRALAILEKAFLSRNFAALILVTKDPKYRSNLTTFTADHAAIQTLTLVHYYKELIASFEKDIELIKGEQDNILTCHPHQGSLDAVTWVTLVRNELSTTGVRTLTSRHQSAREKTKENKKY